jgi:hypothetical protein
MIGYTVDDIMAEGPCHEYPRARVEKLWDGRETLEPREIAELDIPLLDRIWVLSKLLYRLSPHRVLKVAHMVAFEIYEPINKYILKFPIYEPINEYILKFPACAIYDMVINTGSAAWRRADVADRYAARDAAYTRYLGWLVRAWEVRT